MRISDWSSDVCSSDLLALHAGVRRTSDMHVIQERGNGCLRRDQRAVVEKCRIAAIFGLQASPMRFLHRNLLLRAPRSEEHTSELQSLMRTPYAAFASKKKPKVHSCPPKQQHTK